MNANPPGKIITFYSYKGGTGRSMALANIAWILASNGKRVLVVDWDLEAPGLHAYFYPFLLDKELTDSDGVIDFVTDFALEAMTLSEADAQVPKDWYKPHANILRYAAALDWDFGNGAMIDFVPAGRQGPPYSTRVNSFNWEDFYDRLGGGVFLEAAKEKMREEYDYILIDSRTGVSDTSGICTVQMPDILVACFTLNNQSIEGAAAVVHSVYEQRRESGLQIFPVPTRVENAEKEKLDMRWEYAKRKFASFPAHIPPAKREQYWSEVAVSYIPYYAYEEILATFGDRHRRTDSLLASMEKLTTYLIQEPVKQARVEDSTREETLAQYNASLKLGGNDEVSGDTLVKDRIIEHSSVAATTAEQDSLVGDMGSSGKAAGGRKALVLGGVLGVLLLLMLAGGVALALFGSSADLFGSESTPANNNEASEERNSSPSGTLTSKADTSSEEVLRAAVEDYYAAVDRQDWDYTYDNLDSQTKQRYTRDEYVQKNRYLAGVDPVEQSSPTITSEVSTSSPVEVTLIQTFASGATRSRLTHFVWEDGAWKHRFSEQDDTIFLPDDSYDEFVARKKSGT